MITVELGLMMLVLLLIVVMAWLVRFVFKTSDLTEVFLGFIALIILAVVLGSMLIVSTVGPNLFALIVLVVGWLRLREIKRGMKK